MNSADHTCFDIIPKDLAASSAKVHLGVTETKRRMLCPEAAHQHRSGACKADVANHRKDVSLVEAETIDLSKDGSWS